MCPVGKGADRLERGDELAVVSVLGLGAGVPGRLGAWLLVGRRVLTLSFALALALVPVPDGGDLAIFLFCVLMSESSSALATSRHSSGVFQEVVSMSPDLMGSLHEARNMRMALLFL